MSEGTEKLLEEIADRICSVRGHRVLLDRHIAAIYGVPTKRLNEALKRNLSRFPADFAFVLSNQELVNLRSQFATSSSGHGGRRHLPWAFTEHGAIMVATILNSARAVQMAVYVVRAFVQMRNIASANGQLGNRLDALEKSFAVQDADTRRQFREVRTLVSALATPAGEKQ